MQWQASSGVSAVAFVDLASEICYIHAPVGRIEGLD